MPRDGHTSLTISDDTFEDLERHKPDDFTWDEFLERAARQANPYPDDANRKLHLHEQTRHRLQYINTKDTPGDGHGKVEVYYWGHGGQFLMLPYPEINDRLTDEDGIVKTELDPEGL